MMFWMMLYDIFDANTDYQNEKVQSETYPLTNLVFYLPNSLQITFSFDHPSMKTEEIYIYFDTYIYTYMPKILFAI